MRLPILLTLSLALAAQAPVESGSPVLLKNRVLAHKPVLALGALPALPRVEGRPEQTLRPQEAWFEALDKASRQGRLPATLLPEGVDRLKGQVPGVTGWQAYLILVPAQGRLKVRLHHPEGDQFRLEPLGRYGTPLALSFVTSGPGRVPSMEYRNEFDDPEVVVVVVQDSARLSERTPFELEVARSWKPGDLMLSRPKDPYLWAPVAQ